MKYSGLLFLVIALMHNPHERNCVKITNEGFVPNTPNSRTCFTWVRASSQMILDEGETLDNLPPDFIFQHKCPYYEDGHQTRLMGPKNGSWSLYKTKPVKSCLDKPPDPSTRFGIQCNHSTGRTYGITSSIGPFWLTSNCSLRLFLGEVAAVQLTWNKRWIITNEHGLKGLTKAFTVMEFAEAPYFNHSDDADCKEALDYKGKPSKSGASDRRLRTDMILIFWGVPMTSAVLSF